MLAGIRMALSLWSPVVPAFDCPYVALERLLFKLCRHGLKKHRLEAALGYDWLIGLLYTMMAMSCLFRVVWAKREFSELYKRPNLDPTIAISP